MAKQAPLSIWEHFLIHIQPFIQEQNLENSKNMVHK